MDIKKFLKLTRNVENTYTRKDHPSYLNNIFKIYWEIEQRFKAAIDSKLELIVIQSTDLTSTQIVELDKHYIVVNISQFSFMSQLLEFCAFQSIDQENLSVFYKNWEDSYKGETLVHKGTSHHIEIKVEEDIKLSDDQIERFKNSIFMEDMINADGFKEFFGACVIFLISHELAHYYYGKNNGVRDELVKGDILDLPSLRSSSLYLRSKASTSIQENNISQEELYCDYMATEVCWSICVITQSIDTRLIGVALSLLFNSLYFFSLQKDIYNKNHYTDLKVRHATTLLRFLSLHEYDVMTEKQRLLHQLTDFSLPDPPIYDPDYESFIALFDVYCFNMALVLARQNIDINEKLYGEAFEDLLKIELGRYLPPDLDISNPIEAILHVIRENASSLFK